MQTSKTEHLVLIKNSLLVMRAARKRELNLVLRNKHVHQEELDRLNKDMANIAELVNAINDEL